MPWDSIGSLCSGGLPELLVQELALEHLQEVMDPPPPGHELGICWHDHDYGSYPTLGVWSEFTPDQRYVRQCEDVLYELDRSDEWEKKLQEIKEEFDRQIEREEMVEEILRAIASELGTDGKEFDVSSMPGLKRSIERVLERFDPAEESSS